MKGSTMVKRQVEMQDTIKLKVGKWALVRKWNVSTICSFFVMWCSFVITFHMPWYFLKITGMLQSVGDIPSNKCIQTPLTGVSIFVVNLEEGK